MVSGGRSGMAGQLMYVEAAHFFRTSHIRTASLKAFSLLVSKRIQRNALLVTTRVYQIHISLSYAASGPSGITLIERIR